MCLVGVLCVWFICSEGWEDIKQLEDYCRVCVVVYEG